jgi:hypothetical protein
MAKKINEEDHNLHEFKKHTACMLYAEGEVGARRFCCVVKQSKILYGRRILAMIFAQNSRGSL